MLSYKGLYDNSNQRSLHAVLFSSLVCIEKLQQSTWNALRYAIWDCVFKWKAIQQAIQFLTGLKSGQGCWGCALGKPVPLQQVGVLDPQNQSKRFLAGKQLLTHAHHCFTLLVEFTGCERAFSASLDIKRPMTWLQLDDSVRQSLQKKWRENKNSLLFPWLVSLSHVVHLHIATDMLLANTSLHSTSLQCFMSCWKLIWSTDQPKSGTQKMLWHAS